MQYLPILAIAGLYTATASAAPAALHKKSILAGGPAIVPIPANCTLQSIQPPSATGSNPTSFKATPAFISSSRVYTMNIPADSLGDQATLQQRCLEQCYGFGDPGQCVAATWGQNVTYTAYGATSKGISCQFFGSAIEEGDLVEVVGGEYLDARATNILCPSPRGS